MSPPGATAGPQRRGTFSDWLVDAVLDHVRVVVFKYVGRWTAATLAARLESSVQPGPIAMRSLDPEMWQPLAIQAAPPGRKQRVLLFVHGTFSSTRGSFGHLVTHPKGREFFSAALKNYDLIFGFDHRTLTEDPMMNAAQVLPVLVGLALPAGSTIDAIAYSRGGLVLRSLMEGLLGESPDLLPGVAFGCAVFVGCTNGGTHLADSENVKDLLDTYTNLFARASTVLGTLGGPAGITIGKAMSTSVGLLGRFAQAIADAGIEDKAVPGLAAMRPDSEAIKSLNSAKAPGSDRATYFAISANFESRFQAASGIAKGTTEFLIDRVAGRVFKNEANDLVVDTAAMTALGELSTRLAQDHIFPFGETDKVYHITYFSQPEVAEKLTLWLGLPAAAELKFARETISVLAPGAQSDASAPEPRRMRGGRSGRIPPSEGESETTPQPKRLQRGATNEADSASQMEAMTDCHFAARMPPNPALGRRTRLEVIVSRVAIVLASSATSAVSGPVGVSSALPLTIEVIGLKNARVIDPVPAEIITNVP